MPFIHIKSLQLDSSVDVDTTIESLSHAFADANGVGLEHITVTWEFFGHYAEGGKVVTSETTASHPIIVDLLAPDINSSEAIENMLLTIATSIAKLSGVSIEHIFVNYRRAHSGMVFDGGEVVRW